ncbi:MAG: autotransporter-associated beta strand repeat-containing protein, partial [Kiritimatiellaeota bacterium]|nr:autotransporter-associated beta strand repeat-containing protein [Kiritimatiellota bacterium]
MKRLLKGTVAALVALAGAVAQAVPNVLVNLDATDFDPVQVAWTNNGTLGGVFVPVGSGEGTTYGIVDGIAAVSLAGDDSSVMTNGVSPNVICADVPWSFEAWVHNPAAQLNEDVMFTWTAREQWPNNQPNGSCVEFRYGKDSGNAVEHYAENLGWGGELPAFGQWHHVAVTRDAGGVERLYLNGVLRVTQYRNVNARDDIGFFTLGAVQNRNNGGWQFPFSGSFARLRVHDGPLGIEDIFANIQADLAAFGVSMSSARYWKGAPGVWDAWATGANWVGGGVPLDGDSVIFDNGGKAGGFAGTITLQNFMGYDGGFEMTGGELTSLNTVTMGLGTGRSFDFQLKGGKFNIPGTDNRHLLMGENTSAQAVIGGTGVPAWLCVDKDIHLARRDGGDGYMEILPNGLVTTSNGWLYLTCEGVATGTLVVAGGTVRNERGGPLVVGQGRGGKATLIVNSGYAGPFGEMRVSGDQNNEGSVADIFLNGGTTEVQRVRADWAGMNTFHFNGGTLRNRDGTPRTDFMHGLTAALVQPGGACFDVIADTTIEVYQNLLEDPSDTGGGLVKTGPGTLVLRGANTFTGGITVGGGALFLRNDDALPGGYAGNILLQGGGIGWETAGGAGALLGLLDQSSSGALFLFGVNESDPIDLSQHPGVSLGMTGNMEYQGALSPSGGGGYYRFTVTGGGNHYGQVIAGNMGLILEEASTGHLGLHGDNTYTGDTLIYGGTIYMYHANALGNPLTKQNARDIGIYNGTAIALDVPITQAFLDRIKTDSRGSIVLINDNNNNESFDFSALPGVTLGSSNWRDYWGTVTPHAGVGYHFGGGGQPWWDGGLRLRNLTDAPGGAPRKVIAEFPGTVELVEAQSFSGGIVVTNGANLRVNRDDTMGAEPPAPAPDYLLISGGSLRIESDGGLPMLTHTNRGLTVGSGGATFYPPGNRYTAWMGGLNGSGPIMASDNGVLMFGGENNTWDGILTMASDNEDGAFTVGYGDTFSWPRDNIIQGNGQFGVSTDLDITWSDKFANPLGNVPPQPDATDGKNARLGMRKL